MIVYLDTSVVLRVLFGQPDSLEEWGRSCGDGPLELLAEALTESEAPR